MPHSAKGYTSYPTTGSNRSNGRRPHPDNTTHLATSSIHGEHRTDPCSHEASGRPELDALEVGGTSGSKKSLAALFGVGGSGVRNGAVSDEAAAGAELDAN